LVVVVVVVAAGALRHYSGYLRLCKKCSSTYKFVQQTVY
jgi:hypothetical protein